MQMKRRLAFGETFEMHVYHWIVQATPHKKLTAVAVALWQWHLPLLGDEVLCLWARDIAIQPPRLTFSICPLSPHMEV